MGGAAAASNTQFTKIYYDSPGKDDRSAKSLNAEYVVIKNKASSSSSLKGWTVRDAAKHVYTFGSYTLGAGKSVTLHTGKGTNSSTHLYWGSGNYIWNNDGDTATLKNAGGSNVDTCAYSGGNAYATC